MAENEKKTQQVGVEKAEVAEDEVVPGGALLREPFREVTLTDGTVVKCMPVSPLLIQQVLGRHTPPEAPVKSVTTGAGLEETYVDYTDEEYLRGVQKAERGQREASTTAMLLLGLPEVRPTEDWSWTDELSFLGLDDVPTEGPAGRLAYIKYRLLRNTYDLMLVIRTISQLSGATEQAIKQVMADFQ